MARLREISDSVFLFRPLLIGDLPSLDGLNDGIRPRKGMDLSRHDSFCLCHRGAGPLPTNEQGGSPLAAGDRLRSQRKRRPERRPPVQRGPRAPGRQGVCPTAAPSSSLGGARHLRARPAREWGRACLERWGLGSRLFGVRLAAVCSGPGGGAGWGLGHLPLCFHLLF